MRPSQLRARIALLEAELHRLKTLLQSTAFLNPERQSAFLATRQKVLLAFKSPLPPAQALKLSRLTRQSFTRHFRKLRTARLIIPAPFNPGMFITKLEKHCFPSPSLTPEQSRLIAQKEIQLARIAHFAGHDPDP